ncbi:MAG: pirin [bacterium]|nr:pirin [bacterium]
MARILVQATLPHSRPTTHEFERVNGRFTLYMNAPPSVGLPYGSYPRLAMAWLSTEAVRRREREIELGPTFSSFMYKLGLTPVTGKRGTTSRLRGQLHRLFSTTIRCSYSDETEGHAAGVGFAIAHKHQLWWSPRDPEQRPLWNSAVVLSSEFYDELVAHAVPIDLRALKALKGSPLALDIYSWLTYRMSYLRKPCLIPWQALQTQFGADYGRLRDFKRKFLGHLGDVLHIYPAARVSEQPTGLLLRQSPNHVHRIRDTRDRPSEARPPTSSRRCR